MITMVKALIFSDIHNDRIALEKLMAIDADAYFAAGDLVSWARGLDKMGEVMKGRRDRVYVLPGNHASETQAGLEILELRHGRIKVDRTGSV